MKIFAQLVLIGALVSMGTPTNSHAADDQSETSAFDYSSKYAKNDLYRYANQQNKEGYSWPLDALLISEFYSDRVIQAIEDGKFQAPLFLDEKADEVIDVIVKEKNKAPIVVGQAGSGKTELIKLLTFNILSDKFPQSFAYSESVENAVVLKVSGRRFMQGSPYDLNAYLNGIRSIANDVQRVVVVIDECHFLNDYAISVLRENFDNSTPVPVVLETDSKSYGLSIKGHPSFTSLAHTVMVSEPTKAQVKAILMTNVAPKLEERYSVKIDQPLVEGLVEVAGEYQKDTAEPLRSINLAEEFAIYWQRNRANPAKKPTKVDLFRFIANKARLPVIPQNEKEFLTYMSGIRSRVKKKVVGQEPIVDGLVDQFTAALTSRSRQHSVALIMGPTGVGKTLSAEIIGKEFYGDETRIKELDMTQFHDEAGLNTLFGAPNGYVSSDKEKGILCDFFDGPANGGGILILNEIEEADSKVFTRFMEVFDKGSFKGGDGRERYLGRTLVVLTSNKNTDRILSYDSIRGMGPDELKRRLSIITQDQLKKAFTEKTSLTESDSKVVKSAVLERIDKIYFASPLLLENAVKVTQIEVDKFVNDYNLKGQSQISVDSSFAKVLTGAFYKEEFGARQIRTAVQQNLSKALQEYKGKYGFKTEALVISATLHPSQKTVSYIKVKGSVSKRELTIDGPQIPVDNKLLDSNYRTRLITLEENLNKEVFGQEAAIKSLTSAIKGRALQGSKESPVVGFLLGSTGAGKTQLAKSTARHLYGRDDSYVLLEMGGVQSEEAMFTIFSPPKGIVGSDQPGALEKFLINFPDGGVILFDEMSNAGGQSRSLKEAIAKQFYTIFDEGIYRTPMGKTYDLSKYVILCTGNDGQELFYGASSDSMIEAIYKNATQKPELVRDLLRQAGFSDAFVGRLSFASLMKPTLSTVKTLIAKKLINEWREKIEKVQPINILIDDQTTELVGRLMFTPQSGARSIKHFISAVLGEAVSTEALKLDWDQMIEKGQRKSIRVRVEAVETESYFYDKTPFKSSAILKAELMNGDQVVSATDFDFSSQANFRAQVALDSAMATAYHEMGHAVTAFPEYTGKKVVKITVVPEKLPDGRSALGYAQYESHPTSAETMGREFLVRTIANLLAGSEAEKILGRSVSYGRSDDVKRAGDLARKLILEHHLDPDLDAAHAYIDKDGHIVNNLPEFLREKFDKAVQLAIDDARNLAIETLKANWEIVKAGAKVLVDKGNISGEEFEALKQQHPYVDVETTDGKLISTPASFDHSIKCQEYL